MKAQPHTHDLRIYEGSSSTLIIYGNQDVVLQNVWGTGPRRIARRARRLVRQHDRESIRAGKRAGGHQQVADQIRRYAEHRVRRATPSQGVAEHGRDKG